MDSRIRHAITFMKENLDARSTEKEFAYQAGLTSQHFCVLFKAETGETPGRYLNRLRMDKARELLEDDDHSQLSIKEIAAGVGCSDLSHFVRDFEKRFGCCCPSGNCAGQGGGGGGGGGGGEGGYDFCFNA